MIVNKTKITLVCYLRSQKDKSKKFASKKFFSVI